MKALIFDIDGTLITSSYIDGKLYKEALQDYYPGLTFKRDWSKYKNITDEGLLIEIFQNNNIELSPVIKNTIKAVFFNKIKDYINKSPGFESFPGAIDFIGNNRNNEDYYIAFATGGWRESAIMKLNSAGFTIDGIPIFSSDDSHIRTEIMQKALAFSGNHITDITYFSDASWDKDAAGKLGWNFIAVGKRLKGIKNYDSIKIP